MAMKDTDLRYVGISALWFSVVVTGLVLMHAASNETSPGIIFFILWAIFPYIGLLLGDVLIRKIAIIPKMSLILCVVSLLIFIFTFYAYVGTFGDKSSTYGLIFIFVPLYLNLSLIHI